MNLKSLLSLFKAKKEKAMQFYRQGDVTLRPITELPEGAVKVTEGKNLTVALGEVTGHHHTFYGGTPNAVIEWGFDDRKFVQVNEELDFDHQEHTPPLRVLTGFYEVTIEREYDYFEENNRKVRD